MVAPIGCSLTALILTIGLCQVAVPVEAERDARTLVKFMVEAVGGTERLRALKDVEYEYTYLQPDGKKDVSLERYIFDGELSWAKYLTREAFVAPQLEGELVQGFDGSESWATLNGSLIDDPNLNKINDFMRKTNFYWFTMMFKLLDPGINYKRLPSRVVNGVEYDVVEVFFEEGVGDAQDTYVLYVNPVTHLIDQFLFTVMDFGMSQPLLMVVKYAEVDGLKLPTARSYVASDWEGNIRGDKWTAEISDKIRFGNDFTKVQFQRPSQ